MIESTEALGSAKVSGGRALARGPGLPRGFSSVIDALEHWSAVVPDKSAYVFIESDARGIGDGEERLSYRALQQRVAALATNLCSAGASGQRVLIVMPSGLDYLVAFLACLAAGAVAVPLYPPTCERDMARLRAVVEDCRPKALLLNAAVRRRSGADLAQLANCLCIEDLASGSAALNWRQSLLPGDLAFLQYTSGSTGDPKGVMVTHANILHNHRMMAAAMSDDEDSVFVSWLPFFHDMGMIGMNLRALGAGAQAILMAPRAFVRDPAKWLRLISHYRATNSGAPNFAYDLCVAKVQEAEIDALDLSTWRVAYNGAESVKPSTLEQFYARFSRAGLKRQALFPCYGLAEATLFVAGGPQETSPTSFDVERESVQRGTVVLQPAKSAAPDEVVRYVGLGIDREQQDVRIVDPGTWATLPELRIGEVWIKSPSVALGYWGKPNASADVFEAYTTDDGDGRFLRTGDLGFVVRDSLVITGRMKDVILINGVNHYPEDIESTVQALSQSFRAQLGAAFNLEDGELAVVQAVNRRPGGPRYEELIALIRQGILQTHGIAPIYVALVTPSEISRTSSGKTQRSEIRKRSLEKTLRVLASWPASKAGEVDSFSRVASSAVDDKASLPLNGASPLNEAPLLRDKLDWVREYCRTRVNSFVIDERRTIPPYVVLDFGNQGLLGMQVPREYGGLGFSTRELLGVMELLGSKDLTLALFVGLNNVLGIRPILQGGTPRLKERYLPALASGRELAALALTEAGAGSNPQAIQTQARACAEGAYRITGSKIWSGSAAWSSLINVFAQTIDRRGRNIGVSAFAVPQLSRGVSQGPEALTMGMRGMIQNEVRLQDVEAQAWQVLGQPGHGMDIGQDTLCHGRLAIGAVCLGATKLCFQTMLRYAGEREISTGSLLHNAYTRVLLTETMHTMRGVEALIDSVAEEADAGRAVAPEVLAICKTVSTEVLWKAADRTLQLAGGRGYIETNFIPQLFRDARVFRIFEGPTETLHHFVGSSALRGRSGVRDYLAGCLDASALRELYDSTLESRAGEVAPVEQHHEVLVGDYLNEVFLYAATCRRSAAVATRDWLLERVHEARARLIAGTRQANAMLSVPALLAMGDEIDGRIGRREQQTANPNLEIDAYLRPRTSASDSPPAPDATAPAQPSATPVRLLPEPAHGMVNPGSSGRESQAAARAAKDASSQPSEPPARRERGTQRAEGESGTSNFEVTEFLCEWVSRRCRLPRGSVRANVEFAMLGLGSVDSIELSSALSEQFSLELSPTVLWSYPTIAELAGFVLGELQQDSRSSAAE